jgi:S-adenosylmethionine/arginine decarboxylase-like enzyme
MGSVTIDVYVCNYTTDNTAKAERLFRLLEQKLGPSRTHIQTVHRGGVTP